MDLLTFPFSLFDGLMRRQVGLERKFSLWSFMVINASGFARMSTRSSIPYSVVMVLASKLISLYSWSWAFLYDLVMFSLMSFSWVSADTSYKLLVLSAKTSRFGDFLISLTSFFNVFWKGSATLRNFILLVISNMSFSN